MLTLATFSDGTFLFSIIKARFYGFFLTTNISVKREVDELTIYKSKGMP